MIEVERGEPNAVHVGQRLTSSDPEPPIYSVARDDLGRLWSRDEHSPACWTRDDSDDPDLDPESWTKIAGNYGPVTITVVGEGDD